MGVYVTADTLASITSTYFAAGITSGYLKEHDFLICQASNGMCIGSVQSNGSILGEALSAL
jgi:hypothetical protein